MDSIKVQIYIISDNDETEKGLRGIPDIKDVSAEFKTIRSASETGDLELEFDKIVISEEIKELEGYFGFEGVGLIYIGSSDDLTDIPENLLDVWEASSSDEYRRARLFKALNDAITKYRAWLYENYLMSTIDSMLDLVWYKDSAGLHWLVNNKFEDTVHKTRAQIHGMGHNYIWDVPPEDGGKSEFRCLESEREVMAKQTMCVADEQVKTANGALRHFLTYKSPLYDRAGRVMGTVGIGHDVTDMNNASLELKILLENLPMATLVCDENWKPFQINPIFTQKFGISEDKIRGVDYQNWKKTAFEIINDKGYDEELHSYHYELSQGYNNNKSFYSLTEQGILDYYGNITGYYCFFRDITEARNYEKMILIRANTDELTKLYNRRYFFDELVKRKDEPVTVLFMDMDNFKKVNDTFGHNVGDDVLVSAATKIKSEFPDGVVARLGGDEFAVALFGAQNADELILKADKLTESVEKEFEKLKVGLSMSTGMAQADGNIKDIDEFINMSDQRMYEQKLKKKDRNGETERQAFCLHN